MNSRRRLVITGAPVALAGLVFLSTGASARADAGTAMGPVAMTAQAVALQTVYQSLSVPFGLPFAVGSYGASAGVDAGGSTSDAGAPYSPLVSSLPSAGNGVAGTMGYSLPVVPTFPGYVSAQYPSSPIAEQKAGGYELTASTGATEAEGRASIGAERDLSDRNNLFALAHTMNKDGTVSVDADAGAVALNLPGILDLANSSSQIHVTRADGDAHPTFTSTTSLGTITFAGTTSGVTGNGSQVAGAKSTPINVDALPGINKALEPTGVSLSYLPSSFIYTDGTFSTGEKPEPKKTVRGLTSGALQILYQKDIQGQGPTMERITVGQVSVTADGGADSSLAASAGPAASGAVNSSSVTPTDVSPLTTTAAVPALASSDAESAGPAVTGPTTGARLPADNVAFTQSQGSNAPNMERIRAEVARIERLNFSLDDTYPILVVVGAAMLVGSVLARLFGIRLLTLRRR
jgi:hypothetical protein